MTLDIDIELRLGAFTLEVAQTLPLSGITALIGQSASGKTTLLRVLAGLEDAATGSVRFGETTWQGAGVHLPPHERHIGYVFQEARLFPHLNVADNLAYGLRWQGRRGPVAPDLIDALDLGPLMGRSVGALSGGEARRVALARALAPSPALMLLDEPLTGLDSARKARLLPFIARALKAAGCPAIYVSHDRGETNALADRKLRLSAGRVHSLTDAGPVFTATPDPLNGELMFAGQHVPVEAGAMGPVRFRIAEQFLRLTTSDPGAGNSLFNCAAEVAAADDSGCTLRLMNAPDAPLLPIRRTTLGQFRPAPGQRLWLLVGRVDLLPA